MKRFFIPAFFILSIIFSNLSEVAALGPGGAVPPGGAVYPAGGSSCPAGGSCGPNPSSCGSGGCGAIPHSTPINLGTPPAGSLPAATPGQEHLFPPSAPASGAADNYNLVPAGASSGIVPHSAPAAAPVSGVIEAPQVINNFQSHNPVSPINLSSGQIVPPEVVYPLIGEHQVCNGPLCEPKTPVVEEPCHNETRLPGEPWCRTKDKTLYANGSFSCNHWSTRYPVYEVCPNQPDKLIGYELRPWDGGSAFCGLKMDDCEWLGTPSSDNPPTDDGNSGGSAGESPAPSAPAPSAPAPIGPVDPGASEPSSPGVGNLPNSCPPGGCNHPNDGPILGEPPAGSLPAGSGPKSPPTAPTSPAAPVNPPTAPPVSSPPVVVPEGPVLSTPTTTEDGEHRCERGACANYPLDLDNKIHKNIRPYTIRKDTDDSFVRTEWVSCDDESKVVASGAYPFLNNNPGLVEGVLPGHPGSGLSPAQSPNVSSAKEVPDSKKPSPPTSPTAPALPSLPELPVPNLPPVTLPQGPNPLAPLEKKVDEIKSKLPKVNLPIPGVKIPLFGALEPFGRMIKNECAVGLFYLPTPDGRALFKEAKATEAGAALAELGCMKAISPEQERILAGIAQALLNGPETDFKIAVLIDLKDVKALARDKGLIKILNNLDLAQ